MPEIAIIDDGGERVTREVVSRDAAVRADNTDFTPAVVQNLKYDHKGNMSQLTTEAGETENRRESNQKPTLTMEGVITDEQLPDIRSLRSGQSITLVSDVYRGEVVIQRTSFNQSTDLIYYESDGERELAFNFQLQMKVP